MARVHSVTVTPLPGTRPRPIKPTSLAVEQSAHHAAEEAAGAATATVVATAAARVAGMMHALVVGLGGSDAGRDDLREQRLVLELVQIAGGGIVARGLPALDNTTGCFIEPAVDLGIEAE